MSAAPLVLRDDGFYQGAEDIRGVLEPTGYHILVYIVHKESVIVGSSAGLRMTDERRKLEEIASPVAQVIALGPLAYQDEKRFPDGKVWCRPGDHILIRPYSGTRFVRAGHPYEYRLINDDAVEAVLHCDPHEIMRPEAV
jgi:co-chaperonin GroES (HSP10)